MATDHAAQAVAAAGLTLFGVSTGLDPAILLAGFAGGLWAQSYHPPMRLWQRVALTLLASVLAGYFAPAVAAGLSSIEAVKTVFSARALQFPAAVVIGLTCHSVLGPGILRIVKRKTQAVEESPK